MSRFMSIFGIVLALAFMALSAAINWHYGHSIGRTGADQYIFAGVSLAADIAKALAPFFFWYAASNARLLPALASALFWIAVTGWSLSSAGGFAELNRAEQTGIHVTKKSDHTGHTIELARKEQQLKDLGTFDPPAITAQRLEAARQNLRWARSRQCTDATSRESRIFCAEYHLLEAARQKGVEAARLESEIASLRTRLAGLAGAAASDAGDPRARFLSRLTGWELGSVETALTLLFIAVLEIGSGLGLFIALSHGGNASRSAKEPQPAQALPVTKPAALPAPVKRETAPIKLPPAMPDKKPVFGDVAKFARARLAAAQGDTIAIDDLYAAYRAWCTEQKADALTAGEFKRQFIVLCTQVGFRRATRGGKHLCLDLKLAA